MDSTVDANAHAHKINYLVITIYVAARLQCRLYDTFLFFTESIYSEVPNRLGGWEFQEFVEEGSAINPT